METPHEGSTLVCDFPFKELIVEDSKEDKLYSDELDEDGYPIQSICVDTDDLEFKEDYSVVIDQYRVAAYLLSYP